MDTVLVPVASHPGWARDVAAEASEIESNGNGEAVLVHLFDPDEVESTRSNLDMPVDGEITLDELAARKAGVSAAVDEFEEAKIDTRVRGVRAEQDRGRAILAAAKREGADRIYLYGRKRSPAGKAVFGSAVQRVLLNASCPVVVVPAGVR